MTSNIGSELIRAMTETGRSADIAQALQGELSRYFRPEFINRLDDIVVFDPLKKEDLGKIIDIQLKALQQRLKDKGLSLTLSAAAYDRLVEEGYDPVYGARPLKRVLQQKIQNPLAMKILQGVVSDGPIEVDLDAGEGVFVFRQP